MKGLERVEFNTFYRGLVYLNLIFGLILLVYPMIYYPSIGDIILPILAIALSIANFLIAVISAYRFALIEKYPYLINLPALTIVLYEADLAPIEKGSYINKMFGVILKLGVLMGAFSLSLEYMAMQEIVFGISVNPSFLIAYSIIIPIAIIMWVLIEYARIYKDIKLRM